MLKAAAGHQKSLVKGHPDGLREYAARVEHLYTQLLAADWLHSSLISVGCDPANAGVDSNVS